MLHFLAVNQYVIGLTVVGFVLASLLMILIVLVQRPQGGGLSDAFGSGSGGGAGATAFGAKTGDALTTGTIGVFLLFLALAIALNFMLRPPEIDPQSSVTGDATPPPAQAADTGPAPITLPGEIEGAPVRASDGAGEELQLRQIDDPFATPPAAPATTESETPAADPTTDPGADEPDDEGTP